MIGRAYGRTCIMFREYAASYACNHDLTFFSVSAFALRFGCGFYFQIEFVIRIDFCVSTMILNKQTRFINNLCILAY